MSLEELGVANICMVSSFFSQPIAIIAVGTDVCDCVGPTIQMLHVELLDAGTGSQPCHPGRSLWPVEGQFTRVPTY